TIFSRDWSSDVCSSDLFNQTIVYGRDVSIDDIISISRRFPMMAERQVVIVREAQELSRTIENLGAYVQNLMPSTVLVICYKYKKIGRASCREERKIDGD